MGRVQIGGVECPDLWCVVQGMIMLELADEKSLKWGDGEEYEEVDGAEVQGIWKRNGNLRLGDEAFSDLAIFTLRPRPPFQRFY